NGPRVSEPRARDSATRAVTAARSASEKTGRADGTLTTIRATLPALRRVPRHSGERRLRGRADRWTVGYHEWAGGDARAEPRGCSGVLVPLATSIIVAAAAA